MSPGEITTLGPAADMDFAAGLNRAACMKRRKRVVLQQSIVRPIFYNFGGNSARMKADFGILRQCLSAAGERRSLCNLHNNTPQNIEMLAPPAHHSTTTTKV